MGGREGGCLTGGIYESRGSNNTYQVAIIHVVVNTDIGLVSYLLRVPQIAVGEHECRFHIPLIISVYRHVTDGDVDLFLGFLRLQ